MRGDRGLRASCRQVQRPQHHDPRIAPTTASKIAGGIGLDADAARSRVIISRQHLSWKRRWWLFHGRDHLGRRHRERFRLRCSI